MFTLTTSLPDEKWCVEVLRKVRWSDHITCPYCSSGNIKKDGWYRSYQKYRCRQCRKWFNDKTGTMFHYSRTPLGSWFLTLYLFFVLWPGCSTREAALEAGVPYTRCYRFIRTVMQKLSSVLLLPPYTKLNGTVESDEFYIKAGLKGRPYHDEIIRSGRKPRRCGLKPWSGCENLRRYLLHSSVVVMDPGSLLFPCAYARPEAWLPIIIRPTRMCPAHGWEVVGPGSMTTTYDMEREDGKI